MAGGIYEQSEWPDSRWDCVTVCDGCHTVVWGTFWDDYDSAARDAYFARNAWLRPTHAYTHAFREVDAQLSARERVVANLLLTEGRTA